MMNNILLDELPTEYESSDGCIYPVNTWYQIGIQIYILNEDNSLLPLEKNQLMKELLFADDNGELRDYPSDLDDCISWFLNGWNHDNSSGEKEKRRIIDFDVDQFRIFADFLQIYRINLNESDMHWWMFCGLLWNMPYKYSSFLQVIDIRKKEVNSKMDKAEKKQVEKAKKIYDLNSEINSEFTSEEIAKIDEYDMMIEKMRKESAERLTDMTEISE